MRIAQGTEESNGVVPLGEISTTFWHVPNLFCTCRNVKVIAVPALWTTWCEYPATKYDPGMTTMGKIAVSLPVPQIDAAKQAVREGRAPSVSAYVAEALLRRQQEDVLSDLVAGWIAEDGVPSEEDYAWAEHVLGGTVTKPRRRRTKA